MGGRGKHKQTELPKTMTKEPPKKQATTPNKLHLHYTEQAKKVHQITKTLLTTAADKLK